MIYRGRIKNGVVVFDEDAKLPDGTAVYVQPVEEPARKTLAERFKNVIGIVDDLPADKAENHSREGPPCRGRQSKTHSLMRGPTPFHCPNCR